jgi:hypothetical protein
VFTKYNDVFVECSKVDEINAMGQRTWSTIYNSDNTCSVLTEALNGLMKWLMAANHWKKEMPQVIWCSDKGMKNRVVLRKGDWPVPTTSVEHYGRNAMGENYWSALDVDSMNRATSLRCALKEIIEWCHNNEIKMY